MNYEAVIAEKNAQIAALQIEYQTTVDKLKEKILGFQDQIHQLRRLIYGRKSERFIPTLPGQLNLFIDQNESVEQDAVLASDSEQIVVPAHVRKKSKHRGRQLLESCRHLPVEEEVLEVEHSESDIKIGELITEKLAYQPGRLLIRRIIRPKYKSQQTGIISVAPALEEPFPKCEADISLLVYLTVSKFVDHLPEYRLRSILKREGVVIPAATMNGWTHRVAELIGIMARYIEKQILNTGYIQMDESRIRVLAGKKQKTHLGFMWVIHSPENGHVRFKYFKSRDREGPEKMLKNYSGILQTDGYSVYEEINRLYDLIYLIYCLAHARRKFEEALATDKKKASQMLVMIQQLYAIEEEIRTSGNLDPIYRKAKRKKAKNILKKMYIWLRTEKDDPTNIGKIAKAINYIWKRWFKLCRYKNDGRLEIDNNLIENSIRPLALGRKNYLFAGSHEAADNYAIFYTVFGTCKKLEVNPTEYLTWYLEKAQTQSIQRLHEISPAAYKKLYKNN